MVTELQTTMMTGSHLAERYVADHPGTTMSKNAIKCMLRSGVIPSVVAGRQRFYSYERFCRVLDTGNTPATACADM